MAEVERFIDSQTDAFTGPVDNGDATAGNHAKTDDALREQGLLPRMQP